MLCWVDLGVYDPVHLLRAGIALVLVVLCPVAQPAGVAFGLVGAALRHLLDEVEVGHQSGSSPGRRRGRAQLEGLARRLGEAQGAQHVALHGGRHVDREAVHAVEAEAHLAALRARDLERHQVQRLEEQQIAGRYW